MIYTLRNSEFEVKIKSIGAELCSFCRLSDQTEYIWQADPAIWGRHAPLLFPIVGRLPEHKYILAGQTYHLPQHGFARDLIFEMIELSETSLLLALGWSDHTLPHYPFQFRLLVEYKLEGNCLQADYRVQNLDEQEIYFSIGAHPGFNCPLSPGLDFTDYYLEFEKPQTMERNLLENGLLNGKTKTVLKNDKILPLRRDLFEEDAIVLKENKIESIILKSDKDTRFVEMQFNNYPYLGIWSPAIENATFVCLEPWHGVASSIGKPTSLREKEGIIALPSGQKFECNYQIIVG